MAKRSAGILLYRGKGTDAAVLLVHPGGPYWTTKDVGAWQLPKGEIEPGESACDAALREFDEELGIRLVGHPHPLVEIRQAGGKWVDAFAVEGEFDPTQLVSRNIEIEWPPRSGRRCVIAELDRAAWFALPEARRMILPSQRPLIDALHGLIEAGGSPQP